LGNEDVFGKRIVENGHIERKYDSLERIVDLLAKHGCRLTIIKEKDGKIEIDADCSNNCFV